MKRRRNRSVSQPAPTAAPAVTKAAALPQRRIGLLLLAVGLEAAWLLLLALLAWWS